MNLNLINQVYQACRIIQLIFSSNQIKNVINQICKYNISYVNASNIVNTLDITNALNTLWQVSWYISILSTIDKLKIY